MRKLFFAIIMLTLTLGFYAQEIDTLKINFAILNPEEINLDLRIFAPMQRVYVTADFTIDKANLPEAVYHCLFLTKDATIEQILVNDQFVPLIYTTKLVPEHFNPIFPYPEMLKEESNLNCFSFHLANLSGKINFKLRYSLPIPEWIEESNVHGYVTFSSDQNWFPRNLTGACKVYARLLSSTSFSMEIGTECKISEKDGLRTTEGYFIDLPNQQSTLKIIKS
ncbi:MAG: hypothetical protein ABFC98_08435 [Candidatus Cloacimonas sp.]